MSGERGIRSRVSYPGIDVAKLLMSFVVVEIHTRPLGLPDGLVGALLVVVENMAVPFFFIASGFLCFRGMVGHDVVGADAQGLPKVRKTAVKLLRLYLTWMVIFLPLDAYGAWLNGWSISGFAVRWVRGLLLVGESVFSWPLWYLLAAAVGFGLVYLMLRGGVRPRCVLLCGLLFALCGWGLSCLHNWVAAPGWLSAAASAYFKVFLTVRNGLFLGFFYIAFGMCLGLRSGKLRAFSATWPIITLLLGFAGCVLLSPDQHLPFCALASCGIFLLCSRSVSEGNGCPTIRNTSTVVYLTHMIFVVFFTFGIFGGAGPSIYAANVPHCAVFACSLACALLLAAAVVPLSRRHPKLAKVFGL